MTGPSIWDRVNTGVDQLFGYGNEPSLSPEELRVLRGQGLLSAAGALLTKPPSRVPQSFLGGALSSLGTGLMAGQQGAYQGLAARDAMEQRAMSRARLSKVQGIRDKYQDKMADPASLMQMFQDLVAAGEYEPAKSIAELLKSMTGGGANLYHGSGLNPTTHKYEDYSQAPGGAPVWNGVENINPQEGLQQQRNFQRADALQDDYMKQTQPWQVPYAALKRAQAFSEEAKNGNSSAQLQLLYAFINTLDNSVVREGEAAMFLRAAPLLARAQVWADKLALNKGAVISRDQVEEIEGILRRVNSSFENRFEAFRRHYTRFGKQWNVDPQTFISIPDLYKDEPGSSNKKGNILDEP